MKTVVMEGRGRWMIGADLGLSRSYLFIGGMVSAVSDEDAAILLDRAKTGDHVFALSDDPAGEAALAEAKARAAEKAAGWSSPGKCCDDEEGEGVEVETVEDDAVTLVETAGEGEPTFIDAAGVPTGGQTVGKIAPSTPSRSKPAPEPYRR